MSYILVQSYNRLPVQCEAEVHMTWYTFIINLDIVWTELSLLLLDFKEVLLNMDPKG